MFTDLIDVRDTVSPTPAEAATAGESARQLAKIIKADRPLKVRLDGSEIELPAGAVKLLMRLLSEMALGHALTLIPLHAELTTQRAADLLGVSRPFLIKQLETGKVPFRTVGKHRRICFGDLMAYKRANHEARLRTLDTLASESQALGLE